MVSTLLSLGWLETEPDGTLTVAHDLVTDQLVESVLLPERDEAPDTDGAHALLAGCLVSPRAVGRAALNLGRVVNDLALADRSGPVSAVLNSWFTQHATTLGAVLRTDDGIGGYALGAVCSGAPWSVSAVQCWSQVVSPWLADHGSRIAARHLLYRGLHHLPEEGARLLLPTVWSWLARHRELGQASFVLAPVLHRPELEAGETEQAVSAALVWLALHASGQEAQFVLNPLLSRTDLDPVASEKAVTAALTWLERYTATQEAGFVLEPLLSRTDLDSASAAKAIEAALTWLDAHTNGQEARFVLHPLLSRTDLDAPTAAKAVEATLTWLDLHAATQGARFVLNRLQSRTDLDPVASEKAVAAALTWLEQHTHTHDADFVLKLLLSRTDLDPDTAEKAVASARAWLASHHTNEDADFVLGSLLKQLPRGGTPPEIREMVDTWVGLHTPQQDFTFLSKWVLRQRLMSPTIYRALLHWARTNLDNEDLVPRMAGTAFHVWPYVRTWEGARDWLRTVELCLDHAERHGPPSNVNGVLDALVSTLAQQFRTGIGAAWADDCLRRWIALPFSMDPTVFRHNDGIVSRCHALLLGGGFDEAERARITARLRTWVASWPPHERNTAALAYIDAHMLPPRPVPPPARPVPPARRASPPRPGPPPPCRPAPPRGEGEGRGEKGETAAA
ncbi:hypothetical protein DEJ46_17035 [Streptomyces venezuelae]|uniref:Uncharacterized protein n=1 Tax=Streptomyces venezuelae TaxID=54571 RepID=A0A5P2AR07_STRVZ|nr:hypothetical protein DEJ46_17035 [Streptomyces venezuelae]